MSEANSYDKAKASADADVESIEVGDTASDIESKVLGITHISGTPSHQAEDADEANDDE